MHTLVRSNKLLSSAGHVISSTCLLLLFKRYYGSQSKNLQEKNIISLALSILVISVFHVLNLFLDHPYLAVLFNYVNFISCILLLILVLDLCLIFNNVVKDVSVNRKACRRRFLLYAVCGWVSPIFFVRLLKSYLKERFYLYTFTVLEMVTFVFYILAARHYYSLPKQEHPKACNFATLRRTLISAGILITFRWMFGLLNHIHNSEAMATVSDFVLSFEGLAVYLTVTLRKRMSEKVEEASLDSA